MPTFNRKQYLKAPPTTLTLLSVLELAQSLETYHAQQPRRTFRSSNHEDTRPFLDAA